jgi:putative endonuclease
LQCITTTTTELGRVAEARALRHLEAAGLQLLTRNYRCRAGELDLVMIDAASQVLVLVEVRSRSRSDFGIAAATISADKQRRCSLAARHLLLTRRELRRLRARFDVIAIDPSAQAGGEPVVTWIKNAFELQ